MSGSGQTLGGGPPSEPPPSHWGRSSTPRIGRIGDWDNGSNSARSNSSGRFATLSSLGPSSAGPPRPPMGRDDNDDDDDDDDAREGENWFAGGERSGISVQNPNARGNVPGGRLVQDILRRAAETSAERASLSLGGQTGSAAFRGGGHTLGGEDVESTFVPDPNAAQDEGEEEVVHRNITFWRNGFSVEGGSFYSFDDPENEALLAEINTGRAPMSILNVELGQPVEVGVSKRTNEDYVPERQTFGGSGNRLGSPVPAAVTAPATTATRVTTLFEVDQAQPTTTVQIRLADGTRMPCRMNLTHTVGDIRHFIDASRAGNATRGYTIGTTFPNRILDRDSETIEEAGLRNSVVVQRWV